MGYKIDTFALCIKLLLLILKGVYICSPHEMLQIVTPSSETDETMRKTLQSLETIFTPDLCLLHDCNVQ